MTIFLLTLLTAAIIERWFAYRREKKRFHCEMQVSVGKESEFAEYLRNHDADKMIEAAKRGSRIIRYSRKRPRASSRPRPSKWRSSRVVDCSIPW